MSVYLSLHNAFQRYERNRYATQNLIYNILGISVRILCIIFFVPHFGIHAYICGMFCGYLLHNILTITKLASLNS